MFLYLCVQIDPLDEVHHQVLAFFKDEVVRHSREVGMAQSSKKQRLTSELPL